MGWWTDLRDTAEAVGSVAGNYFLPGSGLITSQLVSDGAKQKLGTDLGRLAMLGTGIGGGAEGNLSNWNPDNWSLSSMSASPEGSVVPTTTANTDLSSANTINPAAVNTASPALTQSTVSQGSNITTDGGMDVGGGFNPAAQSAPMIGADYEQMPGNGMFAGSAVNAPLQTQAPGFLSSLGAGNFGDALGAAGSWAEKNPIPAIYAGGSLYDMYAKNQMAKKQEALYNQNRADIMNTYAPGSAEYNALWNEMSRKDAAAGRNSQYGTRATDLAATIAKLRMGALSNMQTGQNALFNTSIGNQYGMMNTPLTLAALTATQKPAQ